MTVTYEIAETIEAAKKDLKRAEKTRQDAQRAGEKLEAAEK